MSGNSERLKLRWKCLDCGGYYEIIGFLPGVVFGRNGKHVRVFKCRCVECRKIFYHRSDYNGHRSD